MRADPTAAREIFLAAVERPAQERSAYLDQACGTDIDLRQRVDALVQAHDEQAAATGNFPPPPPASLTDGGTVGERIGPYKLLQKLGEGGMGMVWLAEQSEPVRRKVALKVIKAGMDTALVIARFEAERQALALMDHPNIAKILDASATSAGRPFFVMELVKGIPITKYCDQEHLTPTERLALFIPVCQAVQHAHQKGIIHRDLKPSNVIVGLYDGRPVPKVIDFGVAKATGQQLTDRTVFTEVGNIIGTIEYMAPEQAELNNLDIDTRADIYSLGVILYELLAGEPPFASKQLRGAAFTEMLRIIREVEPSKPSTKLSSSDALPSIAANRKLDPKRLTKLVHGDLDWIVMKCLEKERSRRYETANGLALELQRYMANEPVLAGPPARLYRMRKFMRRNRGPVVAASLLLLALIAGVCGTTWGLVIARNSASEERRAKEVAENRRDQLSKANEVLGSIFADLDPNTEEREGTSLRVQLGQRLDQAMAQLSGEAIGDRLTVAGLQDVLGCSQRGLGFTDKAVILLETAYQTRLAELGAHHPLTLQSLDHLAGAYHDQGQIKRALQLFEQAFETATTIHGAEHKGTIQITNNLALVCQDDGQIDRSVSLLEKAIESARRHKDIDPEVTATTTNNLAMAYHHQGHANKAITLYEQILAERRNRLGPRHALTLGTTNNLALAYMDAKGLDKAQSLLNQLVDGFKETLGADHPLTLGALNNLALAHHESGRLDLAIPIFERTLEVRRLRLGADHQHTLVTTNNLAFAYRDLGQLERAQLLFETAFSTMRTKFTADHPDTLTCANNLALLYQTMGQNERARELFEETLEKRKKALGANHQHTLITMQNVGAIWVACGRIAAAAELLEDATARAGAHLGDDHPITLIIQNSLSDAYLKAERFTDAERVLRAALIQREKVAANQWTTAYARAMLGASLLGQTKFAEAEPELTRGYSDLKRLAASIPAPVRERRLPAVVNDLIRLYDAWGKPDEAAKWRKELEQIKPAPGPGRS